MARPICPCPQCGRPSTEQAYPFCSGRCRLIDLNRWFSGQYRIPVLDQEHAEDGE